MKKIFLSIFFFAAILTNFNCSPLRAGDFYTGIGAGGSIGLENWPFSQFVLYVEPGWSYFSVPVHFGFGGGYVDLAAYAQGMIPVKVNGTEKLYFVPKIAVGVGYAFATTSANLSILHVDIIPAIRLVYKFSSAANFYIDPIVFDIWPYAQFKGSIGTSSIIRYEAVLGFQFYF